MTWVDPISFVAKKSNAYLVYCVKLFVKCIDLLGGTHINNTWSPKAHHKSLQPNKDWQKIQPNFVASAVPADNLAPSHAWAPPVTMMTTLALADIKYVLQDGSSNVFGSIQVRRQWQKTIFISWVILGSGNDLASTRRQAIGWTNVKLLSTMYLKKNISKCQIFWNKCSCIVIECYLIYCAPVK